MYSNQQTIKQNLSLNLKCNNCFPYKNINRERMCCVRESASEGEKLKTFHCLHNENFKKLKFDKF